MHHHPKRTQEEIDELLQFVADKTTVPVLAAQEGEEYAVDAMEAN